MKVRYTEDYLTSLGVSTESLNGEAIAFETHPSGMVIFTVIWYGRPGTRKEAASHLETVK